MLDLHRLSPEIGAQVRGLDLSAGLSDPEVDAIRAALVDCGVLIFPSQELDEEQHLAFARRFGTPEIDLELMFPAGM